MMSLCNCREVQQFTATGHHGNNLLHFAGNCYKVSVALIDLDPKPLDKIPTYFQQSSAIWASFQDTAAAAVTPSNQDGTCTMANGMPSSASTLTSCPDVKARAQGQVELLWRGTYHQQGCSTKKVQEWIYHQQSHSTGKKGQGWIKYQQSCLQKKCESKFTINRAVLRKKCESEFWLSCASVWAERSVLMMEGVLKIFCGWERTLIQLYIYTWAGSHALCTARVRTVCFL